MNDDAIPDHERLLEVGEHLWPALAEHGWTEGTQTVMFDAENSTVCVFSHYRRDGHVLTLVRVSPYHLAHAVCDGTYLCTAEQVWRVVLDGPTRAGEPGSGRSDLASVYAAEARLTPQERAAHLAYVDQVAADLDGASEMRPQGPFDGGELGGDHQIGRAWARRFCRRNNPAGTSHAVIDVTFYPAQDGPGEPVRVVRVTEYAEVGDPDDPGGSEIRAETEYAVVVEDAGSPVVAEALALLFCRDFSLTADGTHPSAGMYLDWSRAGWTPERAAGVADGQPQQETAHEWQVAARWAGERTEMDPVGVDSPAAAFREVARLFAQGYHYADIHRRRRTGGYARALHFTRPPRAGDWIVGTDPEVGTPVRGRIQATNGKLFDLQSGESAHFERYDPESLRGVHYDPARLASTGDAPPEVDPIDRVTISAVVRYRSGLRVEAEAGSPEEIRARLDLIPPTR